MYMEKKILVVYGLKLVCRIYYNYKSANTPLFFVTPLYTGERMYKGMGEAYACAPNTSLNNLQFLTQRIYFLYLDIFSSKATL